ncbi:MAG: shikimate dehydrogenase [Candidatus Eisenbacteria bacterium]|nr:shikimate dehydrogenase [Candidatus Eisenbacteria bacterium]
MSHPVRLAVLGDPLAFTRSPELHRAGLAALGLAGDSRAIRTPRERLAAVLDELAAAGYRGVNLTYPLKEAALGHLDAASDAAQRARSVNTVGFEPGRRWGDTTDGPGLVDLLAALGRDAALTRTVLLGAGGAARSLALALAGGGASLTVSARDPARAAAVWEGLAAAFVAWRSPGERAALAQATLVVHCTPLVDAEGPAPVESLPRAALVVDLVYGPEPTPWVRRARAAGLEAHDGLGLLVHQARRSLALWTGREVPLAPLARAVGWPR